MTLDELLKLDENYHKLQQSIETYVRTVDDRFNLQQMLLLISIEKAAGQRANVHYTKTNSSYTIGKLITMGLVSKVRSKSDQRSIILQLTAEGKKTVTALSKALNEILKNYAV